MIKTPAEPYGEMTPEISALASSDIVELTIRQFPDAALMRRRAYGRTANLMRRVRKPLLGSERRA